MTRRTGRLQDHWDLRAALNFTLGGAGAGLMVVGGLLPDSRYPIALSLALIACGLAAVWLETGRKLRAVNVFFNPFTSWMSRESFCAVLLFAFGFSYLMFSDTALLAGAALCAAAFLYCQARILHGAKGIPAWRAPEVVPLIVSTGLAEGCGLALFFSPGPVVLALFFLATVARAFAWRRYREAVPAASLARPGAALLWLGTLTALVLAAAAWAVPALGPLAGLAALAPGGWLKVSLVTRAAFKQPFALPHLPVRGTR